jgi:hypothetical protein
MLNWDSRAGSSGYGRFVVMRRRVLVDRDDRVELRELGSARRVHLRIEDSSQGVHDVGRGKLSAIVKAHAGAQLELPGQPVDGSPPLQERRPDLAVRISIEEGLEEEPEEALRLGAIDLEWIERRGKGRGIGNDQIGSVGAGSAGRPAGQSCRREHERQPQEDQPSMNHKCHTANFLPPGHRGSGPVVSRGRRNARGRPALLRTGRTLRIES